MPTGMILLAEVIWYLKKRDVQLDDFFIDETTAIAMKDFFKFREMQLDKICIYFDPVVLKEKKLKPKDVKITNLQLFTPEDKRATYRLLFGYTSTVDWGYLPMPIKVLDAFGYDHAYRRLLEIAGSKKSMIKTIPAINKKLKLLETT